MVLPRRHSLVLLEFRRGSSDLRGNLDRRMARISRVTLELLLFALGWVRSELGAAEEYSMKTEMTKRVHSTLTKASLLYS